MFVTPDNAASLMELTGEGITRKILLVMSAGIKEKLSDVERASREGSMVEVTFKGILDEKEPAIQRSEGTAF